MIGALIPIRLASERLPGKAIKEICGRPVVHHLLDRVAACRFIEDKKNVVVCTTKEASDDALVDVVENFGASVFRGSTDDILKRFGDAMDHFGFDAVVQADGDDPLSATEYMDLTMEQLLANPELDIVTVTGVPLGTATKSFTNAAMKKVLASYVSEENDTGFIDFFTKTGICNHLELTCEREEHVHDSARLTLDYQEDFDLFTRIFEALYSPDELFGLDAVVALLREHPKLVAINQAVEEEYWQRWNAKKSELSYRDPDGKLQTI